MAKKRDDFMAVLPAQRRARIEDRAMELATLNLHRQSMGRHRACKRDDTGCTRCWSFSREPLQSALSIRKRGFYEPHGHGI